MSSFPYEILEYAAHRPWPMPERPWLMTQSWHNLLFAHWPVDAALLRTKVPSGLSLDVYEGQAWIGIVPFHMTNVAPRGLPSLPYVSEFAEVNVRTYVTVDGRPGVYFFSLDAESAIAVATARTLLRLPYYMAQMEVRETGCGEIEYACRRTASDVPPAELRTKYRPVGPEYDAKPGTLDYFLTERYCLYNVDERFGAYRLEIHHPPWKLRRADAAFDVNTMADAAEIRLQAMAPLLHFSKRQDMIAWAPAALE